MSIIIPANSAAGGAYEVDNSARFESNTYMTKSTSSGNTKTFTISFWTKRSALGSVPSGSNQFPISFYQDGSNRLSGAFLANNTFIVYAEVGGSTKINFSTNRVFRDTSAWMHFVIKVDTTQGTEANRFKLYINGVEETSFSASTYPSQNDDLTLNTNLYLGTYETSNNFFHGYLSEFVYIDGTAYDPTSFGEFDEDSGIWKPIDVSGLTFGTNGFYLDFEDSANLGNDANGGTDLTEYNFTAIDQSTDTCTNNFAILNNLENFYPDATISEGNLKAVTVTAKYTFLRSSIGVSSGKWYMETKCTAQSSSTNKWTFGITDHASTGTQNYIGENSYSYGWRGNANEIFYNGTSANYGSGAMATGNIIGMALDLDNNKIYWSINGTWKNSGNPAGNSNGFSITAPASTNTGYYHFAFGDIDGGSNFTYETNFGSPPYSESGGETDGNGYGNFAHEPPSGYFALNTKNLAEYG